MKVAPSRPELVYLLAESREGTLFRSEDRGESFTKVLVRLINQKGPVEELWGAWGGHPTSTEQRRFRGLRGA